MQSAEEVTMFKCMCVEVNVQLPTPQSPLCALGLPRRVHSHCALTGRIDALIAGGSPPAPPTSPSAHADGTPLLYAPKLAPRLL